MNISKILNDENLNKVYEDEHGTRWTVARYTASWNFTLRGIDNKNIEDLFYLDDIVKMNFIEVVE